MKGVFSKLLLSSLHKASMEELEAQMKRDPDTHQLMTAPAYDLPEQYLYLLGETFPGWESSSLYDLIDLSIKNLGNDNNFFSKSGDKITGWVAYTMDIDEGGKFISNLKTFSFDINKPNVVLMRDLKNIIDDLLKSYYKVTWAAAKDNPANRIYQKLIEAYKGKVMDMDNGTVRYFVYQEE